MTNALQAMISLNHALFEHGKKQPGRSNHLLDHALRELIIAGASFEKGDFVALNRCGVHSSMGTFSPCGDKFYTLAVLWGNVTAAKSWENVWGWEPWMWNGTATVPGVSVFENRHDYGPRKPPATPRVCMLSVLTIGGKLWRVYGIDKDVLSLVHFPEDSGTKTVFTRSGGRRWRISREEWAKLRAAEAAEKSARVEVADPIDLLPLGRHLDEEIRKHAKGWRSNGASPQYDYWWRDFLTSDVTDYRECWESCDSGHAVGTYLVWIGLTKSLVDGSAEEIRRKYPWKKVEQAIFRFVRECRGLPLRDGAV